MWVEAEEDWKLLMESSHFLDRILEEAGFWFTWVGLSEVAYVSSGLSSVNIFVLITFASFMFHSRT